LPEFLAALGEFIFKKSGREIMDLNNLILISILNNNLLISVGGYDE